jgi:hypothetical protein
LSQISFLQLVDLKTVLHEQRKNIARQAKSLKQESETNGGPVSLS